MTAPVTVRRELWHIAGLGPQPRWVIRWTDEGGHDRALPRRTRDNAIRLIDRTRRRIERRMREES